MHLRAIRDALREAAHRRLSLEEWLGIGEQLRQPWSEETPFFPAASRTAFLLPQMRRWLLGSICSNALTGLTMSDTPMTWRSGWPDMSVASSEAGVDWWGLG